MEDTFFLVTPFYDNKWQPDFLVQGRPFGAVRRILGGGWDRVSGDIVEDRAMAAFRGDRKVLILRFPDGTDREAAEAALHQLSEEES